MVWNFCVETQHRRGPKRFRGSIKFFSGFDFNNLTSGLSKEPEIILLSATIQLVGHAVALSIKKTATKKWKIPKYRKSYGTNRSLGWVPFKTANVSYKNGQLKFNGKFISLWDSYDLSKYELRTGSFSQDSRGRWYFNTTVEFDPVKSDGVSSIGIDLGCKYAATCSDGTKLSGHWFRDQEKKLAIAQMANKKYETKNIHARIKNKRLNDMHKFTTNLVKNNAFVVVGDVSSAWASQTNLAKSAQDAAWGIFRSMLEYKSHWAGIEYMNVPEKYTTQTCSTCGVISDNSPKGTAGLGIREWTCDSCGTTHDRDVNAARNILAVGHGRLAG